MTPRASAAKSRRYLAYGWRFATEARYRTKVLSLVNRHVNESEIASSEAPDAFALSRPWLEGKRLYFIGGCEFTYIRELFDVAGAVTFDTFAHHRPSDPLVEVGDGSSPIWEFAPDVIVLSQAELVHGMIHRMQWGGRQMSRSDQDHDLAAVNDSLEAAIRCIRSRLNCPIFLLGHPLIHRPSLGVYDQALLGDVRSLAELVVAHRQGRYEIARRHPAVYVLDTPVLLENFGIHERLAEAEILGEHFLREGAQAVALGLLTFLHAADPISPKVKVVVVDLDNTLWSGVLREDGPSAVVVRRHLVRALRYLMARGILVAISSKNDPAESEYLSGLLGSEFLDRVIDVHLGWGPKSSALSNLAAQLNLGLDSFAFFDDNVREREEVARAHPEVRVFADTDILRALSLPEFQVGPHLTAEAETRADSYRQQAARTQHQATGNGMTPEEFLISLNLKLVIRPARGQDLPRVAELLQRTNQLNTSGKRTDLAELHRLHHRTDAGIIVAEASDHFGDYGLIGAVTFTDQSTDRKVSELAFSCRAMGRGIEGAVLAFLHDHAAADALERLTVTVIPTSRNAEIIRIVTEAGFEPTADDEYFLKVPAGKRPPNPVWLDIATPLSPQPTKR